ncbi:NAD(P)-dependent oxidoreductase [Novosphingobium sp. BL-8H]|uniref:NAD(P)-dependent oxidoreductase n=1 Tax=Novosphingobium sp. BL-8H TaxID=3127640 RepID=UPI0037579131
MTTKIAYIGLGAMGLPLARHLQRAGYNVTAFDLDANRADEIVALGGSKANSVAQATRGAEVIITCLPATPHVEAVVLGNDGVLANAAPGALLLDMSTIDANGTDRVAKACAENGIAFVDSPIGRLVLHAERGESLFMVGADDGDFARVEPLLKAMGKDIYRCGGTGTGSRMKLVNNFLLLTIAEVSAEAVALGAKLGLDIETILKVTGGTTAQNGQLHTLMVNKVLKGDTTPGFTIDLAFKDMTLAMTAAAEQRMGLPVGAAAHAVYGAARASEFSNQDYSALLDFACSNAAIVSPRTAA